MHKWKRLCEAHRTYSGLEKISRYLHFCLDIFQVVRAFLDPYSGDTCITHLNNSAGIYDEVYQLLALLGCEVIYRTAKIVKNG